MEYAFIGDSFHVDFRFYGPTGAAVDVTSPRANIYDPLRAIWLNGASMAGVTVGQYRLIVNDIPTTVMAGTHYAVGYGTYNGNTLYSDDRPMIQVRTAASGLLYATVDDYAAYNTKCDTDTHRVKLQTLIRAATQWINRDCKRTFGNVRSVRDAFTNIWGDQARFILTDYPVYDIVSVSPAGLSYSINTSSGVVRLLDPPPYADDITFQYRAGYTEVPDDVHLACLKLVDMFFQITGREGIQSESIFEYSMSMKQDVFSDIRELLSSYRRHDAEFSEVASEAIES